MEQASAITIGILSAGLLAALGFSYYSLKVDDNRKHYSNEYCKQLLSNKSLFSERDVVEYLKNPIRNTDPDVAKDLNYCKGIMFRKTFFGGKTRRA